MKQIKIKKIISALLSSILLASCSINLSAEQQQKRTYTTTDNGRTLIYRSEKSMWNLVGAAGLTTLGAACFYMSYKERQAYSHYAWGNMHPYHRILYADDANKKSIDAAVLFMCGLLFTGGSAWLTYDWYKTRTNAHIPIIILDKNGIWYEGSLQFSWKEVIHVNIIKQDIYIDGYYSGTKHLIEIVSLQSRFNIDEDSINITINALYELMQQHWDEYKKSTNNKK